MRITTIVAALALAATPALMSAQATTSAKPETVYVKGYVTGDRPPAGATVRGVTGVITSTTVYDTTKMSTTTAPSPPPPPPPPEKPRLDQKVSHGAGEAAGEASKMGKKAAHGAGEVAKDASKVGKKAVRGVKKAGSDIKKKVTGKP
jgi:hypothetical protein